MKVIVTYLDGESAGQKAIFDIPGQAKEITIGRSKDNLVSFSDSEIVSRYQAKIIAMEKGFKIVHLNDANATWLNDEKVEAAWIKDGDVLTFANRGPRIQVNFARFGIFHNKFLLVTVLLSAALSAVVAGSLLYLFFLR
jgi:pSer/pThr/pTyr-binding forkhead associated (FHA) protein